MRRCRWFGLPLVVALAGPLLHAVAGQSPDPDEPIGPPPAYEALREAGLEYVGHVRDGTWSIDRVRFDLADGDLYLLEPVDGHVTGAVFLGEGTVRAYPPDAVEHQQLKKLLDAHLLEDEFDRLILRFTDDSAARLRALAEPGGRSDVGRALDLYRDRHKKLFETVLRNPDSRVLADLLDADEDGGAREAPGDYMLALVDGDDHGWFTIEVEPRDVEEVGVFRWDDGHEMVDTWLGFDWLADFDPVSVPDPGRGFTVAPASLDEDFDDITGRDLGLPARPPVPDHERWVARAEMPLATVDLALEDDGKARGTAALLLEAAVPLQVVRLRISRMLEVTGVRWRDAPDLDLDAVDRDDAGLDLLARPPEAAETAELDLRKPVTPRGDELPVVQERHGRRMADDLFEPWVTVVLPRRVVAGERFLLEVAYEGKILERLFRTRDHVLLDTLYWLPRHPDNRLTRYHLTFRVRERDEVVSGGDVLDERVQDGTRIVRRIVRTPARNVAFQYGRFDITDVKPDGLPPVRVYADRTRPGFAPGIREKTIEDLVTALRAQTAYFGPFPFPSLQVTETPTASGQAFPGFLLLSFQSFGELHSGEAELFRSHEVAHQWWGAGVQWQHYRDQWLSEGFAQYGAALHVLAGLEDEDQFREVLDAWRYGALGEVNVGQGYGRHYGFTPAVIQRSQGSDSGPLVIGARLRSTKTPFDYRLLVYEKGAFVLHMLRSMLLEPETGNDGRFRELMRGFAADHMHGVATTDAFETAVTEAFGQPMDWFFDQWVYGVEIPTYYPDLRVEPAADAEGAPFVLRGVIRQDDVSDGFRMPVPIAFQFDGRPPLLHGVWVDAELVEVEIPLPARPTAVEFNYRHGVLARVD